MKPFDHLILDDAQRTFFETQAKHLQNHLIFYGPPGLGKTTCAQIIAKEQDKELVVLNATKISVNDIKALPDGCILQLDEIQYFNKKQQQTLLADLESKRFMMIATTTESPYHTLYNALVSRCICIQFKKQSIERIYKHIKAHHPTINTTLLLSLVQNTQGDLRKLNQLIQIVNSQNITNINQLNVFLDNSSALNADSNTTYQYLSALHKSIRGSDIDASIFWAQKLLMSGQLEALIRRLLVICSEDISLASPISPTIRTLCLNAKDLGMPEAHYPITHAVILLATQPKSNSVGNAFHKACSDIDQGKGQIVPAHICAHKTDSYINPHNHPLSTGTHYVKQQYLPYDIADMTYYKPANNMAEQELINAHNYLIHNNTCA